MDNIIPFKNLAKNSLLKEANEAVFQNDIDKAITLFEKANKEYPGDSSIMYNLAALYIEKGNTEKSEELLKKALKTDPNHIYTLIGLANIIYYKTENFKKAETYIKLALQGNPRSYEAFAAYANLYLLEGNLLEAANKYIEALKINQNYETALTGLATTYNFLGIKFVKDHKFEKAIFYFNQAYNYNEDWLAPKLNMARTFGFIKSYKKAFSIIEEIKEEIGYPSLKMIDPQKTDKDYLSMVIMVKISEAKLLYQKGESEKAKEIFTDIYRINEVFPTLNYSLALIYLDENNLENAEKHIKKEMEITYNSIKVKTLRYIIFKKLKKASSWKNIHFNIIKKLTPNTYKLFDSALLLKKYGLEDESKDLFEYAKQLNPVLYEELAKESDIDLMTNIALEENSSLI